MTGYATLTEALARGRGRERSFRCPSHDDRHASASVNVVKGLWVCYSCHAKGTIDSVIEPDDARFAMDIDELIGVERRYYDERWLDQYEMPKRAIHPYWLSRFSQSACRHFRLGYDHERQQPCYPVRDAAGAVLGVVYRQLDREPKYLYPRGMDKSSLLFNFNTNYRPYVVLVEGAMDAVACWEAGHHALALYGSNLSNQQVELLLRTGATRIVEALDNDSPGRAAVNGRLTNDGERVPGIKVRLEIAGFEVLSVPWDTVEAKDIAACDEKTRRDLLDPLAL